ncbi:hypothetical protein CCR97_08090 [Rhodoplanes elegans]|nr:hypothetical protein [Rhodoplanes elegans]MBK5958171.1 hypothetical protein [Rhodoplanes elegans]
MPLSFIQAASFVLGFEVFVMSRNVHPVHMIVQPPCAPSDMDSQGWPVHHVHMAKMVSAKRRRVCRRRNYLREWREKREMTLEEVGAKIDYSHASLSRIERGVQDYTGDLLEALAAVYGTDPITLLTRHPDEPDELDMLLSSAEPDQRRQIARHARAVLDDKH